MKETLAAMLERVKREHPLTGTASTKKKLVLYRSKLIEYKRRYPEGRFNAQGYEIIEDAPAGDNVGIEVE